MRHFLLFSTFQNGRRIQKSNREPRYRKINPNFVIGKCSTLVSGTKTLAPDTPPPPSYLNV
jgi:hypothetical protein